MQNNLLRKTVGINYWSLIVIKHNKGYPSVIIKFVLVTEIKLKIK